MLLHSLLKVVTATCCHIPGFRRQATRARSPGAFWRDSAIKVRERLELECPTRRPDKRREDWRERQRQSAKSIKREEREKHCNTKCPE